MKMSLYECRVLARKSQEEVAEHLGISTVTYRRFETKYPKKIQAGHLFMFCEFVGQSVSNIDLDKI